ncbi:MAG: hypothetical protein H7Y13_03675 [Sphingobacteriaceae bacterium]|nr:hypothetical protein [Sphingobacteriaceae bacterium]
MYLFKIFLAAALLTVFCTSLAQDVQLKETPENVILKNEYLTVTFNKVKGEIREIKYDKYANILGDNGAGYLMGPKFSMNPSVYKLIRKSPDLIEIAFDHFGTKNNLRYTLHYIIRKNTSGIYCFLVVNHKASNPPGEYGQTRWGLRADERYFDYHLVRDSIQGPMPSKSDLSDGDKVQDWTFKMADGTIYTKYNYADYIEGRHVHGMAGEKSGLGLFVIQASHEYLNGGPTKQYQNVHSGPFLINMFKCGHFLSDIRLDKTDGPVAEDWTKIHGPFLLYVNKGKNVTDAWNDAKKQSVKEINQWPYSWMNHREYPLNRGIVRGTIVLKSGPALANSMVVLAAPGSDWQSQSKDYIFYTKTDQNGNFEVKNVRPGNYTLYAYGGNLLDQYVKNDIVVKPDSVTNLEKQVWEPQWNGQTLWQIGRADRRTTGFKLADQKRDYGLFEKPVADLNFVIGKSKEAEDWYYAQTKRGSWNIEFDTRGPFTGDATLTIDIAGAARWPIVEVWVNNTKAGVLDGLGNDASVYRSAVAGGYYQHRQIVFPSSFLNQGKNIISLKLAKVNPKGGVMYDAIKLESH